MQQLGCTGTRPKCPIRQLPAQIQGAIGSAVPVGGAETCGSNHFAGFVDTGIAQLRRALRAPLCLSPSGYRQILLS
jgi:hypothetical protein